MTRPIPIVCHAIAGIVLVEVTALLTGHNGSMLTLSLVALSGLGGFGVGRASGKPQP